jgi:hypothetical protein
MCASFAAIFDGSLVVTALQLMLRAMETDRKIQICSQILSPWLKDKVDYGIGLSHTGPPAYVAWRQPYAISRLYTPRLGLRIGPLFSGGRGVLPHFFPSKSGTMRIVPQVVHNAWHGSLGLVVVFPLYICSRQLWTPILFLSGGYIHMCRARIFKRLSSPGIDSKASILPAYVAWRAGTKTLFLLGA